LIDDDYYVRYPFYDKINIFTILYVENVIFNENIMKCLGFESDYYAKKKTNNKINLIVFLII